MAKALYYGIAASLFFAVTFVLNRSMQLDGGSYLWSAALRYLFMLPLLFLIVYRCRQTAQVYRAIKKAPTTWLLWSGIGFGLFYLPLTFAAQYAPAWLVAALWQVTIVAGVLLSPLFGRAIPAKNLLLSLLIVSGVALLQVDVRAERDAGADFTCIAAVLLAAVSYPLGNRKMMEHCRDELNTTQRVFGMTLCSLPVWLVVSAAAFMQSGMFSLSQALQSLVVAVSSGVVATVLFFKATDLVKDSAKQLAVVEATQAGEVLFALLGGCLLLGDKPPTWIGIAALLLIVGGMIANSLAVRKKKIDIVDSKRESSCV